MTKYNKISLALSLALSSPWVFADGELTTHTQTGEINDGLTVQCTETDRTVAHTDSYDFQEFSIDAGQLKTLQSNIHAGVQYILSYPGDGELGSRRNDTTATPPVASQEGAVVSIKTPSPDKKLDTNEKSRDQDHIVAVQNDSQNETHDVKAQTDQDAPTAEGSKLEAIEHPSDRAAHEAKKTIIHTTKTSFILMVVLPNGSYHADVRNLDNNSSVNATLKYRAGSRLAGLSSVLPIPYKTKINCYIARKVQ